MADLKNAKLGPYNEAKGTRVLIVPVDGPNDDPRRVTWPKPKPTGKPSKTAAKKKTSKKASRKDD